MKAILPHLGWVADGPLVEMHAWEIMLDDTERYGW